jgi:hypothetical protein
MSDYLSQTTFDLIWDQLKTQHVEDIDQDEFLNKYSLEIIDFDDKMEPTPPSLVETSLSFHKFH